MTDHELQELAAKSLRRSYELEAKYRSGQVMTRRDCDEMRRCTQRIGIVAREIWIANGRPDGFPELEQPIKLSPLPKCYQPLDLTDCYKRTEH